MTFHLFLQPPNPTPLQLSIHPLINLDTIRSYSNTLNYITPLCMAAPYRHHVAALAFPFGTHAAPLLSLVLRLAKSKPNTLFSFITTSNASSSLFSSSPTSTASAFPNVVAHNIPDGLPEGFVPSGHPEQPIGLFLKAAEANFRAAMKEAEKGSGVRIGCLVTDAFFWFAAGLAEEMKLTWIPLWTAGSRSLLVHVATDLIRQRVLATGEKTLSFLPGFSKVEVADLPDGVVSGNLESPISCLLHKMGQELPKATAVAINSFEEAEPEVVNELNSRFNNFLNVGPFNLASPSPPSSLLNDESGCLEWLDKHDPASVVYISFGSVVRPPPHELAAFVEAVVENGFPFIWSFRGDRDEVFPKGCDNLNGKIVSWAPQVKILEHPAVGVFMTHGGWNSILESIVGGVPMIGRPFFGDQNLNMKTVENIWGIGLGIEGGVLTKQGAVKALTLILKGEAGNQMREKIKVLKNLAKSAVEEGHGSSSKAFNSLVDIVTHKT